MEYRLHTVEADPRDLRFSDKNNKYFLMAYLILTPTTFNVKMHAV